MRESFLGGVIRASQGTPSPLQQAAVAPFRGKVITVPLGAAGDGVTVQATGDQLVYLRSGSEPGGRLSVRLSGGDSLEMVPGSRLVGAGFSSLHFTRDEYAPQAGYAKFLVLSGGAQYIEPDNLPAIEDGRYDAVGLSGWQGAAQVQSSNSDNAPTSLDEGQELGVDITGARGLRVMLATNSANTFVSGLLRFWLWDETPAMRGVSGYGLLSNYWFLCASLTVDIAAAISELGTVGAAGGLTRLYWDIPLYAGARGRIWVEGANVVLSGAGTFSVAVRPTT